MLRALWSVPSAVAAWFVVGFAPAYVRGLPDDASVLVPSVISRTDVLVIGGLIGGVAAGLLVQRLRIAVPLVLAVAAGVWWFSRWGAAPGDPSELRGLFIALLVASFVGAVLGALGSHRSLLAAFALTLPIAWYAGLPADHLAKWQWAWELNGLLVAVGLAILLYVACWRTGWRAAYYWAPVVAIYLAAFAFVQGADRVAVDLAAGRSADDTANAATDTFASTFEPLLQSYWPWLVAAVFLAIPMVTLKIRALPPEAQAARTPYDDRSNDAYLTDDLTWFDREEQPPPPRRLLPKRQSA